MKEERTNFKNPWIIGTGLVILAILFFPKISNSNSEDYSSFAECLTDSGAIMYGTEWCPHCKNQKGLFGNSFKKINYVDCDSDKEECLRKGIQGYPTWIIDGVDYPGEQSLWKLSKLTGCSLKTEE